MKRLCEVAGIALDDRHSYLAPHNGRRGMGEVLVGGLAMKLLRAISTSP